MVVLSDKLVIALDGMGGDAGAPMVVGGAAIARARHPEVHFLLYGQEEVLAPLVAGYPELAEACDIRHTDDVVEAEDKPSQAVRRGRNSSMGLAINAVRDKVATVAVSAGNTGALMALAKIMLRTMEGIDRPALGSLFPTLRGESVMLDLGANVECSEENLVQFAVMGAAFARTVLGLERPTVGLLNIGVEDLKGNETVQNAGSMLRDAPLPMEFAGFIEGDGIGAGSMDVIVTDGFTGNVALKTVEGTAKLITGLLRRAFSATILNRIAYLFARGVLSALSRDLDPNNHNGAVFLGLNGLVVKSHGGANAKGFATAITHAVDMARHDLTSLIEDDLKNFESHAVAPSEEAATASDEVTGSESVPESATDSPPRQERATGTS